MHIDQYTFGSLVVDGQALHTDVLLTPGEMHEHWWRREGHVLRLEDLGALLEDTHVERLVVGTGAYSRMRPDEGLEPELAARGVAVEVLPTAAAVDRINDLLRHGATGWAAALHLTCLGRRVAAAGQVADEPVPGELSGSGEGAWFFEQVSGTGYDGEVVLAAQRGLGTAVEVEHHVILSADDQQRGWTGIRQRPQPQPGRDALPH